MQMIVETCTDRSPSQATLTLFAVDGRASALRDLLDEDDDDPPPPAARARAVRMSLRAWHL